MNTLHTLRQLVHAADVDAVTMLLHYSDPYGHAQHLLWSCLSSEAETLLRAWSCGSGPGLNVAMRERGISFELVRCWAGGAITRSTIRATHNNRRYCHHCCFGHARQLRLFR